MCYCGNTGVERIPKLKGPLRRNRSTSEFASLFFPVFFNSYGDCNQEDFPLSDDVYSLRATGAQEMHETLICELTFRAPLDLSLIHI